MADAVPVLTMASCSGACEQTKINAPYAGRAEMPASPEATCAGGHEQPLTLDTPGDPRSDHYAPLPAAFRTNSP
jgi:hypothetical protein